MVAIPGGLRGTPALDGDRVVVIEDSFGTWALVSLSTTGGAPITLINAATALPTGQGNFEEVQSYRASGGVVYFRAKGDNSAESGLFSVPVAGGTVTRLADQSTPVPGPPRSPRSRPAPTPCASARPTSSAG